MQESGLLRNETFWSVSFSNLEFHFQLRFSATLWWWPSIHFFILRSCKSSFLLTVLWIKKNDITSSVTVTSVYGLLVSSCRLSTPFLLRFHSKFTTEGLIVYFSSCLASKFGLMEKRKVPSGLFLPSDRFTLPLFIQPPAYNFIDSPRRPFCRLCFSFFLESTSYSCAVSVRTWQNWISLRLFLLSWKFFSAVSYFSAIYIFLHFEGFFYFGSVAWLDPSSYLLEILFFEI